jgi:thioredoxin 1
MIEEFEKLLQEKTITLLAFYADWFEACKKQAPIIEDIADDMGESIKVITIDVEKFPQLARYYSIQAVPTIIIFKDAEMKFKKAGIMSKPQVISTIFQCIEK